MAREGPTEAILECASDLDQRSVGEIVAFYGRDCMLLVGGSLYLAGSQLLDRTRSFVEDVHRVRHRVHGQEIEPEGLAKDNWIPTVVEGHGTLVIFGKTGASIFRGAKK